MINERKGITIKRKKTDAYPEIRMGKSYYREAFVDYLGQKDGHCASYDEYCEFCNSKIEAGEWDKAPSKNWLNRNKTYFKRKGNTIKLTKMGKRAFNYNNRTNEEVPNIEGGGAAPSFILKETMDIINEKSVSKAQQRLMGMAYAVKKGDMKLGDIEDDDTREKVKKMQSMTLDQLKDFASTKHEGLPNKKEKED
jgi:hypothetical protein